MLSEIKHYCFVLVLAPSGPNFTFKLKLKAKYKYKAKYIIDFIY